MGLKVTNNAFGTLNAGITNSDTTLVLQSGQGSRFPSLSSGDYFYATLIDTSNNLEIVKVTARSTDTMTIVRAQDNTTARAYSTNDRFELRPTAAMLNEVITKADTAQATADAALPKAGGTMTGDLTLNVNAGKVIVNRPSPGVGNENGRWEGRANNSGYISGIRSFVPADQPGVDRVAAAIFTTTYTSSLQTGIDRLIVDPDGRVTTPYQPAFHAIGNGGTFSGGNTITFGSLFQVPSQRSSGFANSRFTAPVSGMYQFNFVAYDFGALVGANFQVFINGGQFAPSDHFQYIKVSDHTMINWSFAQYLTKNDYIQMGFRSGSPSITLYGGHTFWSGYLVG